MPSQAANREMITYFFICDLVLYTNFYSKKLVAHHFFCFPTRMTMKKQSYDPNFPLTSNASIVYCNCSRVPFSIMVNQCISLCLPTFLSLPPCRTKTSLLLVHLLGGILLVGTKRRPSSSYPFSSTNSSLGSFVLHVGTSSSVLANAGDTLRRRRTTTQYTV
jgi:hypothetical protein